MSYPVLCGPRRIAEVGGGSEGSFFFIVGSRVVLGDFGLFYGGSWLFCSSSLVAVCGFVVVLVDSVLLCAALGSSRVVLEITVVVLGGSVFFCIGSWSYCSRSGWFQVVLQWL